MPNPAFLVEGQMEQAIIQRLCPDRPVRLIQCNGETASMTVMAKFIDARIRRLPNYYPIVVIFDREKRIDSFYALLAELTALLDKKGHSGKFIIGMPDRTIESWILADWDSVRKRNPTFSALVSAPEGFSGKSVVKSLLPKEVIYNERTLGVDLFCQTQSQVIYEKSVSFRAFVDQISFPCHWLSSIAERFEMLFQRATQ